MNVLDQLLERSADLSPVVVAALGGLTAFLVVVAAGMQWSVRLLQLELDEAQEEVLDRRTGLLPRSALPVRLGAELAWASSSGVPVAVAVLEVRGGGLEAAARVLRQVMREEEAAFLLGRGRILVELWGATPHTAVLAVRRLGEQLRAAGHPAVDAGIACMPRDGGDVQTLTERALRDLRPVEDPRTQADERGRMPSGSAHVTSMAWGVLPWLAAHLALLLIWFAVLPLTLGPLLAPGAASRSELLWAAGVGVGMALTTALVTASMWNIGGGTAPRSRPASVAGARTLAALVLLQGLLVAWTYALPVLPSWIPDSGAGVLATMLLVVLVAVAARQLHDLPLWSVVAIAVVAGVIVWRAGSDMLPAQLIAAGVVVGGCAIAALVLRLLVRAWMLAPVALAAALMQVEWSDELLLLGPFIGGVPWVQLSIADIVLLATVVAWAHVRRLDLRVPMLVLGGGIASWVLVPERLIAQPLLTWLAAAALLLVLGRASWLRLQAASWHAAMAAR